MAIDWKKVSAADAEKYRNEIRERLEAKEASQKRMAAHLLELVERDDIVNEWEREFIRSVHGKLNSCLPYLTEKQDDRLTKLFEKY